jgi:hypothetical protein
MVGAIDVDAADSHQTEGWDSGHALIVLFFIVHQFCNWSLIGHSDFAIRHYSCLLLSVGKFSLLKKQNYVLLVDKSLNMKATVLAR